MTIVGLEWIIYKLIILDARIATPLRVKFPWVLRVVVICGQTIFPAVLSRSNTLVMDKKKLGWTKRCLRRNRKWNWRAIFFFPENRQSQSQLTDFSHVLNVSVDISFLHLFIFHFWLLFVKAFPKLLAENSHKISFAIFLKKNTSPFNLTPY